MTRWQLLVPLVLLAGCAPEAPPIHEREIVDLTWTFDNSTVYWPTETGFELETRFQGYTEGGYYYTAKHFATPEHGGTHIDAPIHFAEGAAAVDEVPIERLVGPAVVIDVKDKVADNVDYSLSAADVEAWEAEHGEQPAAVELHFLEGDVVGRVTPTQRKLDGARAKVERAAAGIREGEFEATPGYPACDWCPYRRICPAAP